MADAQSIPGLAVGDRNPMLVLLPGLDGTGRLFRPFLDALPPNLDRVVINYSLATFQPCRDLADYVVSRIPAGREVVVLAESYSGLVCLELLRRGLPQIKAVVFAACFATPPRPHLLRLARLLPLAAILRVPPPTWLIERYCLGPKAAPPAVQMLRDALHAVQPEVLARRVRELANARPAPKEIALPCCYIQATEDRLVPQGAIKAFEAMAADLDIRRVEGPHFILQARPRECAGVILEHLKVRFGTVQQSPGLDLSGVRG